MIQRYGFLYGGYSFPYWEVADMVRKLAIAAIPVFIKPQPTGSLQAVLGEVVMVIYIFVISYLKPFASPNDNLLQVGSMLGARLTRQSTSKKRPETRGCGLPNCLPLIRPPRLLQVLHQSRWVAAHQMVCACSALPAAAVWREPQMGKAVQHPGAVYVGCSGPPDDWCGCGCGPVWLPHSGLCPPRRQGKWYPLT